MSMTIQSSVKDKILATSSETSKVENAPAEMLRDLDQQMEKRADDGKANVVTDALSRKERVKPRRVRAMAMTIQYGVRGMILTAQSEAFKQENVPLVGSEMDEAHASRLRWMIYLVVLADATESVRDAIGFEYCLASSSGWTKRKSLEFEVGDRVLLRVSPWKGVVCFGKNDKLAPSLHVPLDEIKVDKTLRFVEELIEIMDREIRNLKRSKISLVKLVKFQDEISIRRGYCDNRGLSRVFSIDALEDIVGQMMRYFRVHGERTQGVVKTLMNTKVVEDPHRLSSWSYASHAKSPVSSRTCGKCTELSNNFEGLQDEVSYDLVIFHESTCFLEEEEHGVHLKLELELLRKEKFYAKLWSKEEVIFGSPQCKGVQEKRNGLRRKAYKGLDVTVWKDETVGNDEVFNAIKVTLVKSAIGQWIRLAVAAKTCAKCLNDNGKEWRIACNANVNSLMIISVKTLGENVSCFGNEVK
ncbi:hypothetical protein Tco_1236629 [Tanacetum coccineum]